MYIHREGRSYVIIATIVFALLSLGMYYFTSDYPIAGALLWTALFLLYLWVWWFFRIPQRDYNADPNAILAPADGKVVVIENVLETEYFNREMTQISIFMSPLNVHVNRSPISAKVKYVKYHPGKYLVAWHPKSSTENERTSIVLESAENREIMLRQIAGAVARRIKYYVKKGDTLEQNQEFGFIQFGSRVDIFLPTDIKPLVAIDQKTQGGKTILAYWH